MRPKRGGLTRGEKVVAFIERYCYVPSGKHVGKPIKLLEFQRQFVLAVYDNPAGTSRAYLSIARKNGKTALIAAIVLAHLVGPEARINSQIISGARSREQAALVFELAEKMVRLNPDLNKIVKVIPSTKRIIGLTMNVEYKAISAEAGTAHGLSPVVAILDEVGQVKGPKDAFVEAIITAQGAHDAPLLLAISTQAATDADLFSVWLDDAEKSKDPRIVSRLYTAPDGCDIQDREAWAAANPAMGEFRSVRDLEDFAAIAARNPADENSFRWLFLNQRIEANAPFVSRGVWAACAGPADDLRGVPVYGGLDLSEARDLTSCVFIGRRDSVWHVQPTFWLPGDGLAEKARSDRAPYDVWHREGYLQTAHGRSVDYEFVAHWAASQFERYDIRKIAFDRWNWRHFKPWLLKAGLSESLIDAVFVPFGQGFQSISPALRDLESALLNGSIAHGGHPVMNMCAMNAVVQSDPAGNRKLSKSKSTGRIDGMVALTMAIGVASADAPDNTSAASPWDDPEFSLVAR